MKKCHWYKGRFPDDLISEVQEVGESSGKVLNRMWACESCLAEIFKPAYLSGAPLTNDRDVLESWFENEGF